MTDDKDCEFVDSDGIPCGLPADFAVIHSKTKEQFFVCFDHVNEYKDEEGFVILGGQE